MGIDKEILEYSKQNLNKIYLYLSELNHLKELYKKRKREYYNLNRLYKEGLIEKELYYKSIKNLKIELKELESNMLEIIGRVNFLLNEIKEHLKFYEETNKEFGIKVENKEIINIKKEVNNVSNNIKIFEEIFMPKEEISESSILKELKKEKKEKKIENIFNKNILKLKKKTFYSENIYLKELKEIFISVSNKLFGNLSDYLLNNYPQLYAFLREMNIKLGINITVRSLLSIILTASFFGLILALFLTILLIRDLSLIILIIFLSIFSPVFIFIFIYRYYLISKKRTEIRRNLIFGVLHISSLLVSGLRLREAFLIVSEMEEYGELAKEFRKIVDLMDSGLSITDSIEKVKETTVSDELKEFLDSLLLTLKSGRDVKEFFLVYSQSLIIRYKSEIDKFIQSLKTFSDLYVGMILTIPMISISILIMLSQLSNRVLGLDTNSLLILSTYIFIPGINLAFIMLIDSFMKRW